MGDLLRSDQEEIGSHQRGRFSVSPTQTRLRAKKVRKGKARAVTIESDIEMKAAEPYRYAPPASPVPLPRTAVGTSGSAGQLGQSGGRPPPPPPPRDPASRRTASASSHRSSPKPNRRGKDRAAGNGDPNSGDSSSHDNDDSAHDDGDLSDASDNYVRRRRRTTTSPPRLPHDTESAGIRWKEPDAPNPPTLSIKRGQNYRLYIDGCEIYFSLRESRFRTEKHRIF